MKLPLKFVLTQTRQTWDDKDRELGDTDKRGFDFIEEAYELERLREYVKDQAFVRASEYPIGSAGVSLLTDDQPDRDAGTSTSLSLHCHSVLDANDKPLETYQQGRIWQKLVEELVTGGQRPEASFSP